MFQYTTSPQENIRLPHVQSDTDICTPRAYYPLAAMMSLDGFFSIPLRVIAIATVWSWVLSYREPSDFNHMEPYAPPLTFVMDEHVLFRGSCECDVYSYGTDYQKAIRAPSQTRCAIMRGNVLRVPDLREHRTSLLIRLLFSDTTFFSAKSFNPAAGSFYVFGSSQLVTLLVRPAVDLRRPE